MCNYEIICNTKNLKEEEWLLFRKQGIGGSDVSIIAGCNPYRSVFELWDDKRNKQGIDKIEIENSDITHFGHVLEDVIRKEFISRTGLKVRKKNMLLRSRKYPFMIADVDGVIREEDGTYSIFEAKTAIEFKNNDWKNEKIPLAYQLQVQHYLAVTGFKKAYIAALVGGNKFYWYKMNRDDKLIDQIIQMEAEFWQRVQSGQEPSVDGSEATQNYLGEQYKESKTNSIVELNDSVIPTIQEYKELKEEMDQLSDKKRKIENQLKMILKDHETGIIDDYVVKWKKVEQNRLDSAKLKKEYAKVYEKCQKMVSYRKFSIA